MATSGASKQEYDAGLDNMTSITRNFIDQFKNLTANEMAAGKVMGNWTSFEILLKLAQDLNQ